MQRGRFDLQATAEACLVSVRTVWRWLHTNTPDPMAVRLLAILAGYVPWVGWDLKQIFNRLDDPGVIR